MVIRSKKPIEKEEQRLKKAIDYYYKMGYSVFPVEIRTKNKDNRGR